MIVKRSEMMRYGMLEFEEPKKDTSKKIIHVDMDAFYASIEVRDQPQLKGKPVVIAKHPKLTSGRGIVSTCNYEARKFGIHSAMSAMEAYRLCPHAIFIQGNHAHYQEVSEKIHHIFRQYTEIIQPIALDEAYLDVTDNKVNCASATLIGLAIQKDIYEQLQLTCSVGVSYNKFLAKLASDYQKPSGITVIEPHKADDFLKNLPIQDFHGVGKKSVDKFIELGIKKGEDLLGYPLDWLEKKFGKMGVSLYFKVRGISSNYVQSFRERKSIGKESTFAPEIIQESVVLDSLSVLTRKVMQKVRDKQLIAHTVTLKIRYASFKTMTRQISTTISVDSYQICYDFVLNLWEEHGNLHEPIRLLGVSVSQFEDANHKTVKLNI